MEKLITAALQFEGNSTSVEFNDSVGIRLTPLEFKLFLEKTFNFKLTPYEVIFPDYFNSLFCFFFLLLFLVIVIFYC